MTKCTCDAEKAVLVEAAQRVWDTIPATFDGPEAEEHSRALVALNVALTLISPAAKALLAREGELVVALERCQAYIHNVLCLEVDEEDCKEEICLDARAALSGAVPTAGIGDDLHDPHTFVFEEKEE